MTAIVTLLDMTAERGSAATLDCAHDTALPATEGIRVLFAIGRAGLAEDVRHFEPDGTQRPAQK